MFRSFTHFLTGVCAIIGGVFTGQFLYVNTSFDFVFYLWWKWELKSEIGLFVLSACCLFVPCSGWSDRFAHLPLSSCHPEEDRAGQGVLTAPPAGLQGATHIKTQRTRRKSKKKRDRQAEGEVWRKQFVFSSSFCLLWHWMRELQRETERF